MRKRWKGRRKRWFNWAILSLFIGLLLYLYIGGEYGLYHHWQLKKEREKLRRELEIQKHVSDSLRTVIHWLKYDSTYMAKVAREKYNMGKPDEEIIRIVNKKE